MAGNEERKKAFVVFASTYEAAKYLTLEQKGELFEKLGAYSLEGKDVHSDNPMVDIILISAFPNMDAAERRHQIAIKNGDKGKHKGGGIGAPRKGETKEEYQARLMEWRRSREESNNPHEPLDNNTNINIDKKRNTDINNEKEINKKTNVEVISDSISTNLLSSDSSNFEREKTDRGEEFGGRRPRQEVVSSHSNENPDRAYPFNYKCGNYVNLENVEPGEPDWINCDPNDFPPLVDEGWTPPPPERQHNEVVLPKQKNGGASGDDSIKARELERLISKAVGVIIDCEDGKKPMNMMASSSEMATNAIMELTGCRKAKAVDMIQELKASFRSEQPMKPLKK